MLACSITITYLCLPLEAKVIWLAKLHTYGHYGSWYSYTLHHAFTIVKKRAEMNSFYGYYRKIPNSRVLVDNKQYNCFFYLHLEALTFYALYPVDECRRSFI